MLEGSAARAVAEAFGGLDANIIATAPALHDGNPPRLRLANGIVYTFAHGLPTNRLVDAPRERLEDFRRS
jgi:hypothetical protein